MQKKKPTDTSNSIFCGNQWNEALNKMHIYRAGIDSADDCYENWYFPLQKKLAKILICTCIALFEGNVTEVSNWFWVLFESF